MPRIDFDTIDDAEDYSPLPDGQYLCVLDDIEEKNTQYGDELWSLKFAVQEGEYEGRKIFDNMVFSEKALKRAKLICSRLGLDVSGEVDLTPDLLKGRAALVTVETDESVNDEGKSKRRNVVPFAGYERVESGASAPVATGGEDASEESLPF